MKSPMMQGTSTPGSPPLSGGPTTSPVASPYTVGGGGITQGGLCFSLFVPAHFGTLDEKAKFHQVMRCCPSCGAPLVLFREKFGEVPGRSSPPGTHHPSTASTSKPTGGTATTGGGSPGPPSHPGGLAGLLTGLTGGWVCTKCGVHIVPTTKTQTTTPASDKRQDGKRAPSASTSSAPGSREVSPQRPGGGVSLQGGSQNHNHDNSQTSPMSPKPPVIIDDDYEIWERQVKTSFTSFLNQIRERLGHKEISLKQYQVTLCQRERQLRSNEENMQQRWYKMRQNEQNFKTKMDRLHLYKDTMIHQLEAKARQLSQYEQRLRTSDFRTSSTDVRDTSVQDLKTTIMDFSLSSPSDEKNVIDNNSRSPPSEMKNTSRDAWNSSGYSEGGRNTPGPQSPSQTEKTGDARGSTSTAVGDNNKPKVAVTMVKPTVIEYRKPQTHGPSSSGETRGSQSALARDFRPNGASSANINQLYTRDSWSKQQQTTNQQGQSVRPMPSVKPSMQYSADGNYSYKKPQQQPQPQLQKTHLSPTHSRNASALDLRQHHNYPYKKPLDSVHSVIQSDSSSNRQKAMGNRSNMMRHSTSEGSKSHNLPPGRQPPPYSVRYPSESGVDGGDLGPRGHPGVAYINKSGSRPDLRHPGAAHDTNVRQVSTNVRHPTTNLRHHHHPQYQQQDLIGHHSGPAVRQVGLHAGNIITSSGSSNKPQSAPGSTRTAIPPQQKPPTTSTSSSNMPLKSALKNPSDTSGIGASTQQQQQQQQRWTTQTNLHVSTTERIGDNRSGPNQNAPRSNIVTSYVEHDNVSLSPSERERSMSADLSPTYTTSGYASDRETSMNGGGGTSSKSRADKEKHNVSFEDMISTSSPQGTVERDTRPPWMKRRSRRLTEV